MDSAIIRFISYQTGLSVARDQAPQGEHLLQNFPNPFNPSTQIRFVIPSAGWAILRVYNLVGQEVAMLVNGVMSVGEHSVLWDARSFPSGVYICRLQSGSRFEVKKLILQK
jgi:hypothetical protein